MHLKYPEYRPLLKLMLARCLVQNSCVCNLAKRERRRLNITTMTTTTATMIRMMKSKTIPTMRPTDDDDVLPKHTSCHILQSYDSSSVTQTTVTFLQ